MDLSIDEALRYLGVREPDAEQLRHRTEQIAGRLTAALQPRYIYRVFPLEAFRLQGTDIVLTGLTAERMLKTCHAVVLLACTLGATFDTMLRKEQARDMADAVILDACGGAYVEAGCASAEDELRRRLSGQFLTDRFSPGYGDLPLDLQPSLCEVLDVRRRLGIYVTDSFLMVPLKSVTAIIGISEQPQQARVRGCPYCFMKENCALRKGGKRCEL